MMAGLDRWWWEYYQMILLSVFHTSEEAFRRDLKLQANESLAKQKFNCAFAILSLLLGFSTIPQQLYSSEVHVDKEMPLDSTSGFLLCTLKTSNGTLFVNNVQSEWLDIRKGRVVYESGCNVC